MIKIKPRGKFVLVQPNEAENRTNEFGIITPSNIDQEKRAIGIVIAVSDEVKDIKIDDKVVYGTYSGDDLKLRDKKGVESAYKILHTDDILAFVLEK